MNRRIVLAAASALALGTFAQIDTAEAGRYRFSGGGYRARVHGGVSINYRRPAYRPIYRRPFVGGRIYVGPRINYYPRARYYSYPRYYYYQPVPSYYGVYSQNYYYPVQPQPQVQTAVVAPIAVRPQLPRFGVGLFGGGVSVDDKQDSDNLGVFGRLRLTPGLIVEAEVGKTTYAEDLREDRRIGASLIYEFNAYNKLAPYVRAGLGVQQADVAGEFETRQNYGELGVGLRYAFTPNLHIGFDVRTGTRATADSDDDTGLMPNAAARTIAPPAPGSGVEENYVSGTVWGGLYF